MAPKRPLASTVAEASPPLNLPIHAFMHRNIPLPMLVRETTSPIKTNMGTTVIT